MFSPHHFQQVKSLRERECTEFQAMMNYIDICSQASKLTGEESTSDVTFFRAYEAVSLVYIL